MKNDNNGNATIVWREDGYAGRVLIGSRTAATSTSSSGWRRTISRRTASTRGDLIHDENGQGDFSVLDYAKLQCANHRDWLAARVAAPARDVWRSGWAGGGQLFLGAGDIAGKAEDERHRLGRMLSSNAGIIINAISAVYDGRDKEAVRFINAASGDIQQTVLGWGSREGWQESPDITAADLAGLNADGRRSMAHDLKNLTDHLTEAVTAVGDGLYAIAADRINAVLRFRATTTVAYWRGGK